MFTLSFSLSLLHITLHLSTLNFIHCIIVLSLSVMFFLTSSHLEKKLALERESNSLRVQNKEVQDRVGLESYATVLRAWVQGLSLPYKQRYSTASQSFLETQQCQQQP